MLRKSENAVPRSANKCVNSKISLTELAAIAGENSRNCRT